MATSSNLRGILLMLLSGFTFVLNDSMMKFAMADLPPYQVLVMRGLSGTLFALVLLAMNGELHFKRAYITPAIMMRAGFECLAILTYIIALAKAPIADVTAIFQTTPLLVILGLIFVHGETAAWWRLALIALGFCGALLVAQPGQGAISPFVSLAFLTAIFASLRDLAARKIPASVPAMVSTLILIMAVLAAAATTAGLGLGAAKFLGLSLVGVSDAWHLPTLAQMGLTFSAGLFMMLGHHFTLLAYRNASAQAVAPFYYSFMLFAVLFGYLLFGDTPNALSLGGMAIIMVSGLTLLALERKAVPPSELP
jgi:drug/metabolite transporter (DMT)-like permease